MKNFITAREGTEKPLLLPADITLITEAVSSLSEGRPEDVQVALATRKSAQALVVNAQQWDIDGGAINDALRANRKTMIEMPFFWGEKQIGRHFVDPAALTYITTSAASKRPGQIEPSVALLLGLKGGGFVESSAVPAKIIQSLIDAAAAANPNLRCIEPETATSRFYSAGFTMYDPADIVRIYQNGHQVNVLYRDGYCSDFDMPQRDHRNDHLNNLFNRIVRMRGGTAEAEKLTFADQALMKRISRHCHDHTKRKEEGILRAFARAVAADCKGLYEFKGATEPYYTSLANLSIVMATGDKALYVDYLNNTPDGKGMRGGGRHVRFRDEAAARVALKELSRLTR